MPSNAAPLADRTGFGRFPYFPARNRHTVRDALSASIGPRRTGFT